MEDFAGPRPILAGVSRTLVGKAQLPGTDMGPSGWMLSPEAVASCLAKATLSWLADWLSRGCGPGRVLLGGCQAKSLPGLVSCFSKRLHPAAL